MVISATFIIFFPFISARLEQPLLSFFFKVMSLPRVTSHFADDTKDQSKKKSGEFAGEMEVRRFTNPQFHPCPGDPTHQSRLLILFSYSIRMYLSTRWKEGRQNGDKDRLRRMREGSARGRGPQNGSGVCAKSGSQLTCYIHIYCLLVITL